MEMPFNSRVVNVFYFWLALLLSWLFLNVIFDNTLYLPKILPVITLVALWALVTHFVYKKIDHWHSFLASYPKSFAAVILALASLIQFYCGKQLAIGTGGDVEAVFKGAINLATHSSLSQYTEYFQIFPHNLGGTLLLTYVFKLGSVFGYENYYAMGVMLNILCVNIGFFLTFLICKQLKGCKTAFLALWLCLACLPIYFYIPIFYTDLFSLPFIPLLYYLYLRSQDTTSFKQLMFYSALIGVACAIGSLIKFTVVIIAVAIVIDILIRKKIVRYLIPIICVLLTYKAVVSVFNSYVYDSVLNQQAVEKTRVPYTHWIMMGLEGNGAYNGSDYQYTYSFADPKQRVDANLEMIKTRLKNYGFWGYLEFATRKEVFSFGSGMYGVYEILDDNPLQQSSLHDFVVESGKYFFVFKNTAQAYHVFLFVLIIFSLFYDLFFKSQKISSSFLPRMAMSGMFLFLLMWEACSRYIINYIPIYAICAALSYGDLCLFFKSLTASIYDAVQTRHKALVEVSSYGVDENINS
jgi:hypothetical protein